MKRRIDATNQLRNDLMEELDRAMLGWLEGRGCPPEGALHSETPGMMIDRLSILSLKIYHTREEMDRMDAPAGHAARNRERLAILEEQRVDLAGCLDALWQEILQGTQALQALPAVEDVQRPHAEPGDLRQRRGRVWPIAARRRPPLTECGVLRINMA